LAEGCQNPAMSVDLRIRRRARPRSACSFVLVDQSAENLAAFDPADRQADQVCSGGGSSKVQRSVRPVPVVMGGVLDQHRPQVPLPENQHPVGALGTRCAYPPLRERVRARRPGRDFDHACAVAGHDVIEGPRELGVPVADQEPKPAGRSPRSIRRLRACWTAHAPSGLAVTPRTCTSRVPTSITKKTYKRRSITVSTEKKSHASVPAAWARTKSRHRSSARRGAGPKPARFRIRRIIAPLIACPRFLSFPRIRSYPQQEFSRASLTTNATITGSRRWPARSSPRIGPLTGDQSPVPAQQRARRHQPMHTQRLRQHPSQPRQDRTISPRQPRPAHLTAQDGDLMTQHEDLHILRRITTSQQQQPADNPAEGQIHQAQRHDRRGCPTPATPSTTRYHRRSRPHGRVLTSFRSCRSKSGIYCGVTLASHQAPEFR
jgi:hypothetical protein